MQEMDRQRKEEKERKKLEEAQERRKGEAILAESVNVAATKIVEAVSPTPDDDNEDRGGGEGDTIVLGSTCVVKKSKAKGEEQCLVLQYQNHQNYTEEFTFYPESESHSGPASSSMLNRFSRSKSTPLPNGGERDSVDFEEARNR